MDPMALSFIEEEDFEINSFDPHPNSIGHSNGDHDLAHNVF